jgi:protein O-mannosyl-transferase
MAKSSKKNKPTQPVASQPVRNQTFTKEKTVFEPLVIQYNRILALIVGLVAMGLYANTYKHGYVIDDNAAIIYNNYVQEGFAGIPKLLKVDFWHFMNISLGYYRPLSLITFAIEYQFFGQNPTVSHIGNIIIYGFTGYLLCILCQRWFYQKNILFAFFVALVFIAHPIHTEVVAYLKSRDESLGFLNIVASLLLFTIYIDTQKSRYLIYSCVTAYLAFLSKESSVVILGLVPLAAYFTRGRSVWESFKSLLPFVGVTVLFFFQKIALLGTISGNPPKELMAYPYAIEGTRFVSLFKQFAIYLKLIFFPHPLVYDYSYNHIPSGSFSDPLTLIGLAAFVGLVFLGFRGYQKRSTWGFGIAIFYATLVPALGFTISRGAIMAERFLYAPILAWAILLVWLVFYFLKIEEKNSDESLPQTFTRSGVAVVLLVAVLGLYGFKTVQRNPIWKSEETLAFADAPNATNNCNIQHHLGNVYLGKMIAEKDPKIRQMHFDSCMVAFRRSSAIYPGYGEPNFGIGWAYQNQSRYDSAIYYYRKCINLNSSYVVPFNNIGTIYQLTNRPMLASYWYNIAVRVNPNYQNAVTNQQNMLKIGYNVQVLPDSLAQYGLPQAPVGLSGL